MTIRTGCYAAGLWLVTAQLPAGDYDAEQSVQAGRDALGSSWRFPWYDGQADGLRRVAVRKDWEWPKWRFELDWLGTFIYYTFWGVGALLIAVLLYLIVRAFVRRESATSHEPPAIETAEANRARIEALPFELRDSVSDLLAEARRLAAAGDFAGAVVYLYSYDLVELDRRQVIRLMRGRTNRQYLREVSSRPGLRELLEPSMVAFEDAFFGHRELSRERFELCWAGHERLLNLTAGGAKS